MLLFVHISVKSVVMSVKVAVPSPLTEPGEVSSH